MHHLKQIRAQGIAEPISPYSDAIRAGNTVYISGVVATDEEGRVVGKGDVVDQTRQIFKNLGQVLKASGAGPQDVAKITIYMRDVAQRPDINPVRREFFGGHQPASTLVEVSRLAHDDLLLEIEAIAVLVEA